LNTTELMLTYVGTVLIAFEFIRESKDIQALVALLFAWPVRSFLNAMTVGRKSAKVQGIKSPPAILLVVYALLMPVMLLLTLVFYIINLVVALLEEFHNLINHFYLKAQEEYQPTYRFWTKITLRSSKKYKDITEQQVINKLRERGIRILPIIGVILITIAFIMHLT